MQDVFLSTSVHKLDRKGRVSVPAGFRAAVSNSPFSGIYIHPHHAKSCYTGFGAAVMEKLARKLGQLGPMSEAYQVLSTGLISTIVQVPFDKEGRVVLPAEAIQFCDLQSEVCFAGLGLTFEIWNPARFEEQQQQARQSLPERIDLLNELWKEPSDTGAQ